ncbi:hypothetical protein GCM10010168_28580 [Actinoplanes ianthinogenes]|uniref:Deazaflavin-dependent oxidoreductase (Nitroreductase family) n=1 Tax=Actinoplanes ianthinogenes TaxID=122358 RepID=A0ABM7LL63_9ACTN|nr:nitroreductase family deazaflavin-dependent oxidoreductase [Actinoplanes ianthinogenes]BCJ40000.1 hypothetical protein Aiant_06570 [Actinoplanes ianthinogenes]GGR09574.1 hypothetical protein GCM10010168_28580 [Actinoplanes ianthinogenes]
MAAETKAPWVPPRWFELIAWKIHRGYYRITGGRRGLWRPRPGRWGAFRLTTVGRRSGEPRSVILAYFEDGPNVVTLAMNGWQPGQPAWWLNLQANPDATIELKDGPRRVHGRAASDAELPHLWDRWRELNADLDGYVRNRSTDTVIVVLEPRA